VGAFSLFGMGLLFRFSVPADAGQAPSEVTPNCIIRMTCSILRTMSLRHTALVTTDKLVRSALFFSPKLPTYYAGSILWFVRPSWETVFSRYELLTARAMKSMLRPGQTFWDIGAFVGWFSLFAYTLIGGNGRIVSFEPAPDMFAFLARNLSGLANAKAIHCGIGNTDAIAPFPAQGGSSAASFVEAATRIGNPCLPAAPIEHVLVPIKRVDTLILELGSTPDVLKIDVEGYELEVLRGSKRLLASRKPALIMEVHPPQLRLSGGSEDELFEILSQCGYAWEIIDGQPNSLYTVVAQRLH
jgi:FkbM family methyltransferase